MCHPLVDANTLSWLLPMEQHARSVIYLKKRDFFLSTNKPPISMSTVRGTPDCNTSVVFYHHTDIALACIDSRTSNEDLHAKDDDERAAGCATLYEILNGHQDFCIHGNDVDTSTVCVARQSLRDEVCTAVKGLGWPALVARRWVQAEVKGIAPSVKDAGGNVGNTSNQADDIKLKVLQWNVLCDGLSGSHPDKGGFVKASKESLEWDNRKWRILEEILAWDCDVLALQEVDHHHDWLSPMLAREGYRSLFVKKPLAPGMVFNSRLQDGCSMFYRTRKGSSQDSNAIAHQTRTTLEILDAHSFAFAVSHDCTSQVPGATNEFNGETHGSVVHNQVAMVALFQISSCNAEGAATTDSDTQRESLVIVGTTHLKATKDEEGERIRAQQANQLLDEVDRFRQGHETGRGLPACSIPLIVAGDFNATPHSSGLGDGNGCGYYPLCYRRVTSHRLALRSAFPVENTFTTWKIRPRPSTELIGETADTSKISTKEIRHCIDYVWVSEGVGTARRSTFPCAEELGSSRVPSLVYPSDHFALAVELGLPSQVRKSKMEAQSTSSRSEPSKSSRFV